MTALVQADPAHAPAPAGATEREVVVYRRESGDRAAHDHATSSQIARRLAALKGLPFGGEHDGTPGGSSARYIVPTTTLVGVEHAHALGIRSEQDIFGGVVPHPFVGTKSITHPLISDGAQAPAGWSVAFHQEIGAAVLDGYTAFSLDDAARAGRRLLARGALRIKRALGIGGNGQVVVENAAGLDRALAGFDATEIGTYGLGLEQNLLDVTTFSVGQVRVDDLVASYCGTQCLTANNHGDMVYGGSRLLVARGDFDALLKLDHSLSARRAIAQARAYDDAAFRCFDGLVASRRNYDVAAGVDSTGRPCSGVLEQSWRVGGASGAEVEAMVAFRAHPALAAVQASTTEVYGEGALLPPGAIVYFHGSDERTGPLVKFTTIEPHVYAR